MESLTIDFAFVSAHDVADVVLDDRRLGIFTKPSMTTV